MKSQTTSSAAPRASYVRYASLGLALAAVPSTHAAITGTITPSLAPWTLVADTTTTPALDSAGVSLGINYVKFDPPVTSQWSPNCAFKGYLAAPATPANNEAVWRTQTTLGTPWLALREGDLVPSPSTNSFGFLGSLDVRNLQCGTNNWLACATNTSAVSGKVGIGYNLTLRNLGESPTVPWSDIRPPVITNMGNPFAVDSYFAMWKRDTSSSDSGVQRQITLGHSAAPTPATPPWATGFGGPFLPNQPARVASPSISDDGWIAAFARDTGAPPNHIRHVHPSGSPSNVIVRQGDLAPVIPGFTVLGSKFGIIHNQLMANSDAATAGWELVAWQMQNMATPPIARTSLWCKQGTFTICLAYQGQSAPDLPPANLITSFYELQAVPDYTTPDTHWVFWGANLTGGKSAIYRTNVSLGVASLPDLIATDVPFTAWVGLLSGGLQPITKLDKFFSVNVHGALVFSAACAGAPAGQKRILVTAKPIDNHFRQVRAQTGVSLLGFGRLATFFDLAKPEQGQCSRGQAVGTQWVTSRISYFLGEGIFWMTL